MIKKEMVKIMVFICPFVFTSFVFAQRPGMGSAAVSGQQGRIRGLDEFYRKLEDHTKRNTNHDSYKTIEGSAYFDESFKQGDIYYDNGYMGTSFLRYDGFADEIQIKKTLLDEEEYGALLKSEKLFCIVDSKKVLYHRLKNANGEVKQGYVTNLVNSGKYWLFVRKSKLFLEGKIAPTSLTLPTNSKFITQVDYYFGKEDGDVVVEIDGNAKNVLGMFDDEDRPKIKSFVRKNKINLDDKSDLQTLFYYANTL